MRCYKIFGMTNKIIIPIPETQYGSLLQAITHVNQECAKHGFPFECAISITHGNKTGKADPLTIIEAEIQYSDTFLLWKIGKHFGYILGKTNL